MAGKYTSDELELLTEEERAGLIEEQGAPEDVKTDPEAGKEPAVEAVAEAAPEAAPAEPEKVEEAPAAEAAPDEPKAEAQPKTAVPNWTVPADTDAKLKALDAKDAEAETKFEAGELTNAEYREQVRAIDKERRSIEGAKLKAEIAAETKAAVWAQQTVSGFLDAHPIYGQNETLFGALDIEVRKLQASAADPFSPSILTKAHAKVQAAFSAIGGPKEAPAAEKPKADTKPAPKVPEKQIEVKPRDPAPPSLAKVPAAEVESTDGGKFAYLDRLQVSDYEGFELALSKLSPADLNAYLASA
jgi:hypothetical protein